MQFLLFTVTLFPFRDGKINQHKIVSHFKKTLFFTIVYHFLKLIQFNIQLPLEILVFLLF